MEIIIIIAILGVVAVVVQLVRLFMNLRRILSAYQSAVEEHQRIVNLIRQVNAPPFDLQQEYVDSLARVRQTMSQLTGNHRQSAQSTYDKLVSMSAQLGIEPPDRM